LLLSIWFYWWAREDSNLQPSGYERRAATGKLNKIRHFRARSMAFVHVWLRRFIGQSLVRAGFDRCLGNASHPLQQRRLSWVWAEREAKYFRAGLRTRLTSFQRFV
jgi:hypothetical protein